jgi:hypothetical protein
MSLVYSIEFIFGPQQHTSFPMTVYPVMELMNNVVVLLLIVSGTSILFSINDCTNSHFHQQCAWIPFSPYLYQHFFLLLLITILAEVR